MSSLILHPRSDMSPELAAGLGVLYGIAGILVLACLVLLVRALFIFRQQKPTNAAASEAHSKPRRSGFSQAFADSFPIVSFRGVPVFRSDPEQAMPR